MRYTSDNEFRFIPTRHRSHHPCHQAGPAHARTSRTSDGQPYPLCFQAEQGFHLGRSERMFNVSLKLDHAGKHRHVLNIAIGKLLAILIERRRSFLPNKPRGVPRICLSVKALAQAMQVSPSGNLSRGEDRGLAAPRARTAIRVLGFLSHLHSLMVTTPIWSSQRRVLCSAATEPHVCSA